MPISTTSNFTLTRNDLIYGALSILGISEPGNEDIATAAQRLNVMCKTLDARGTWLWAIDPTRLTLTTIGSQAVYGTGSGPSLINPNILKLEYCALLLGNTYIPLVMYDKMSGINSTLKNLVDGQPLAVLLHRANLRKDNTMTFYPTPNAAYSIVYNFRRALYDFTQPTDNPDFPQDWFEPLQKKLAYELSFDYSKPLSERAVLKGEADDSFSIAQANNADFPTRQPLKTEFF